MENIHNKETLKKDISKNIENKFLNDPEEMKKGDEKYIIENYIGVSSSLKDGRMYKRNESGKFEKMSEELKNESKEQIVKFYDIKKQEANISERKEKPKSELRKQMEELDKQGLNFSRDFKGTSFANMRAGVELLKEERERTKKTESIEQNISKKQEIQENKSIDTNLINKKLDKEINQDENKKEEIVEQVILPEEKVEDVIFEDKIEVGKSELKEVEQVDVPTEEINPIEDKVEISKEVKYQKEAEELENIISEEKNDTKNDVDLNLEVKDREKIEEYKRISKDAFESRNHAEFLFTEYLKNKLDFGIHDKRTEGSYEKYISANNEAGELTKKQNIISADALLKDHKQMIKAISQINNDNDRILSHPNIRELIMKLDKKIKEKEYVQNKDKEILNKDKSKEKE